MKFPSTIRNAGILILVASFPSFIQLYSDGFQPSVDQPFGISITNAISLGASVLWVDARPEELFDQKHIPQALDLNRDNWDQFLPNLYKTYDPGKTIIVYCSAGCNESEEIATRIRSLGFDNVLVLEGGIDSWEKFNP